MKKLLAALLALTLTLTLAPTALALKDDDDVAYPAEGGSIYIDWSTITVTDADETVTSVFIPDEVISIGPSAFLFCSSLTDITIPENVTRIEGWAFAYCHSLPGITNHPRQRHQYRRKRVRVLRQPE